MLAALLLASLAALLGSSQGAATPDLSSHFTGLDATFGRGTKGIHVVNAMVKVLKARAAT